jgi:simple sugar transport system substrate-binding protein
MLKTMLKRTMAGLAMAAMTMIGAAAIAPSAHAQAKDPKDIRIVFVTHGQANDVYWSVLKNGVTAGAKAMGVKVDYQAPETFDVVRMARLIEAATASHPDGLVVSIPDAAALEAPIKAAKAAGIPIVVIDTGLEQQKPWGLDLYVGGGSEYQNGLRVGEEMLKAGVKHALCVNQEVGNVSLDNRCNGMTESMGKGSAKVDVVAVTMDPTDIKRRVEAFLTAHADVDGIVALGPSAAAPILDFLKERGLEGKYKLGTFDLSPEVLNALQQGKMLFAIDSQQYLQGYLPVVFLTQKAMFKTLPSEPVWTGPAFVTKDDAAAILELSKQGIR